MTRWTGYVALALGAAAILVGGAAGSQLRAGQGDRSVASPTGGEALYRTFCGKCHALSAALSAGFGSNSGGVSGNGGPSLNNIRVPYGYTIEAITEPTGGHEKVRKRITMTQLRTTARWLAQVTRRNPLPALPTDG